MGGQLHAQRRTEMDRAALVSQKMPDQLKLSFALGTRAAVQELIRSRFKVEMPIRTEGEYLKRCDCTPQKSLKKAYECKPELLKACLVFTSAWLNSLMLKDSYGMWVLNGLISFECGEPENRLDRFSSISSIGRFNMLHDAPY